MKRGHGATLFVSVQKATGLCTTLVVHLCAGLRLVVALLLACTRLILVGSCWFGKTGVTALPRFMSDSVLPIGCLGRVGENGSHYFNTPFGCRCRVGLTTCP